MNRFSLPDLGVGLGLRTVHYAHILEHRPDGTTRVKILDFGISKLPKEMGGETLTEMGQSLGTFSFMPPEQIVVLERALYTAKNSLLATQLAALGNRVTLYRVMGGGLR